MMNFNELPEFSKEFKQLTKKYKSLPKDLEHFKQVLRHFPKGNTKHFHVLHDHDKYVVVKARLFCCYLKESSLRIIYAVDVARNAVALIELYFKGDKSSEDRDRVKRYLKTPAHMS